MSESPIVLRERRGSALWITINRPDRRNAINQAVIDGVRAGYEAAHADPDVRVIVITGAGDQAFCAGADLGGPSFLFDPSRPTTAYADLLRMAQGATLPSIAVINGACMAGGMGLMAMADLAIAADHALFGLPEVKVGVYPMQVLSLLQSLVPRRELREWCITGESFDAHTALRAGLLNYVVSAAQLQAKADWLVTRIADKSPTAIRRGKFAMRSMAAMSFDESLAYGESQIALLALTEDAKEGLAAFNEKRKPTFSGR
jgi:methylglutaconyl-CoA hydratase